MTDTPAASATPMDRIMRLRTTLARIADGRGPARQMAEEALRQDDPLDDADYHAALAAHATPAEALRAIVDEQAEDEGLWFEAATMPEAYLQQELRRLHAAIEAEARATPAEALDNRTCKTHPGQVPHDWYHRSYEGTWLCHCTVCGIVPNRSTLAATIYLPMDCPICGRHRVEWDGKVLRCEKCTTSSEWDGFTSERYEASAAGGKPE